MKTRTILSLSLFGIFLALAVASIPNMSVSAKICYNKQQQVVPCPKPTVTDVPPTKTPTPTDTPVATDTPVPTDTPVACVPLTGQDSGQAPTQGNPSFLFSPWILGGGGVFLGILIGLLIGGVIGPMMNRGGIIAPTDGRAAPGELLPAVNRVNGGIVGPDHSAADQFAKDAGNQFKKHKAGDSSGDAGIIGPSDSHSISNVNGDLHSPRDPASQFKKDKAGDNLSNVNGDEPPGPPQ